MTLLSTTSLVVLLQGAIALAAALAAIAFRRRTRILSPPGFIMLAFGMMLEMVAPRGLAAPSWAMYVRAAAIALTGCGVIRLSVESVEAWIRSRSVHISTIATEMTVTLLYAATFLVVAWKVLDFDARRLLALPVLFTLVSGWLEHRDLFAGLLIQSQRSFRPGDWVRIGDQVGQVQETGWRATRIRTRSREVITIPSDVLAKQIMTNYSAHGRVADEITLGLSYDESPGRIETAMLAMLADIPEVLKEPPAEVGPFEFGEDSIRYRIRYWLSDYACQEQVRATINRSLWFVMRRHAIGGTPHHNGVANGVPSRNGARQAVADELRRIDLFSGLTDDELELVFPSISVMAFGRGEGLIRQGHYGDCFYVLRQGTVDVIREFANGGMPVVVSTLSNTSPKHFFGEIALLKGEPRNSTVRARTDVEVLRIDRDGFAHLFRARPEIAAEIARIAALREAATMAQVAEATAVPPASVAEQQNKLLQTMRRIFDF